MREELQPGTCVLKSSPTRACSAPSLCQAEPRKLTTPFPALTLTWCSCGFFGFLLLFFFFFNPQLWCDFDKSIPLKNLTFNSSAVFTDICSYPEVFIPELPWASLGPRYLPQLQTSRTGRRALGSAPEADCPSSPFLPFLVSSAFPCLFPAPISAHSPLLSPLSSSSSSLLTLPTMRSPLSLCLVLPHSLPQLIFKSCSRMCGSLQYRTQCRVSAQTHLCLPRGIGKDGKEEEKGRGEGREEASEPPTQKTPTTLTVVQKVGGMPQNLQVSQWDSHR